MRNINLLLAAIVTVGIAALVVALLYSKPETPLQPNESIQQANGTSPSAIAGGVQPNLSKLTLYSAGSLANGFKVSSWHNPQPNIRYSATGYNGSQGEVLEKNLYTAGGGAGEQMFVYGPVFDIGNYTHVDFWARSPKGARIQVLFAKNSYTATGTPISLNITGRWSHYSLPVETISSTPIHAQGLAFVGGTGESSFANIAENVIMLDNIQFVVKPDLEPPGLVSVMPQSPFEISLLFTERLDRESSQKEANYLIDGAVPFGARLSSSGRNVILEMTEPLASGSSHTVLVSNVKDWSGNSIKVSNASFELSVREAEMSVDITQPVAPMTRLHRGVQLSIWTYVWGNHPNKVPGLVEMLKPLDIGIYRYGGGLWANGMNWSRSGNETGNDGKTLTPAVVDDLNKFALDAKADIIMQINVCDKNPALWADMVSYTRVEKTYGHLRYWEVGNENDMENCAFDPDKAPGQYASEFRRYYSALKAVDPNIKLLGPVPTQPYRTNWLEALHDEMGESLDVLSWHWYQLTEGPYPDRGCNDKASFCYQGGSVDALFSYNQWVGDQCGWWGCPNETFSSTSQSPINNLNYRRAGAEATMNFVHNLDPEVKTAITELGVHASAHDDPINSNHIAAVWAADMLGRLAYNGLDTIIWYDLDTGNGRSIISGVNKPEAYGNNTLEARPLYYSLFMYAQYFGNMMVKSSSNDPEQKVVLWASTDNRDGLLKLMLVNLGGNMAKANISVKGFVARYGNAYEMSSASPLDRSPASLSPSHTTINGHSIPPLDPRNVGDFKKGIAAIKPKRFSITENKLSYYVPPYSAVAIVVS